MAFDYILPAATESSGPVVAPIPQAYCELLVAAVYFAGKVHPDELDEKLPSIFLEMEYYDIGRTYRATQFNLVPKLLMWEGGKDAVAFTVALAPE
jgi:hypothetical protein